MDEIEDYEIQLLLENINWTYKNEWEIGRLIAYSSVAPYLKHKQKIDKLFPLATDNDNKYEIGAALTKEQAAKIEEWMNKFNSAK